MSNAHMLENLCVCEITFAHTYIAAQSDYPMKNKGRYRCGMLYTLKGTEKYTFCDKTVYACPGSVLIIPKNEVYRIDLDDEESIVIAVDFEVYGDTDLRPIFIKAGENQVLKNLFSEMLAEWKKQGADRVPRLKSVFYKILSCLIICENSYSNHASLDKISDAVNYMHNHLLEPDLKIEKLSEIAGISKRYFEKLFYTEFGTTPKDYIIMRKTELAKELLQSEKKSVADVAVALGYNDVYHFSKMFKLKTGSTTGEYKRKKSE